MEIDESKMKEWKEPTIWQKLRNSIVALLLGWFLLVVTPLSILIINIPNGTAFYAVFGLYAVFCLLLGWFFGDNFISYLHAKIENWWDPRDMFR